MGVLNFGIEPGLKSEISACGPSVCSRWRGAFFGHHDNKGVTCGTRETVTSLAQLVAPVHGSQGHFNGHTPWPSRSLVQV